jgi:hypothetical protein
MRKPIQYCVLTLLVAFNVATISKVVKMLKPWVSAACAGSLIGCANFAAIQKTTYPAELKPFMLSYIDAKITHQNKDYFSKPILITFGKLEGTVAGVCTNFVIKGRIVLDRKKWNNADYYDKLTLLYHELGHCDLDYIFHVPATIMNSHVWPLVNDDTIEGYTEQFFNTDYMITNQVDDECE